MVQLTRKNFFATANAGKLTLLAIVDPAGTKQEGCVRRRAAAHRPATGAPPQLMTNLHQMVKLNAGLVTPWTVLL